MRTEADARLYVDAGVLIRFAATEDDLHDACRKATLSLARQGYALCASSQAFREWWVVITRPRASNGYGFDLEIASLMLDRLVEIFVPLQDLPTTFERWRALVAAHRVSGRQAHDANHVATMLDHGIGTILTLDERDFRRYGVRILHPRDVP